MYTFLLVIISILFCGLFAGMELGSFSVNRVRLQYNIFKGKNNARLLYKNLADPQIFVFTMLIFQNIATYISSLLVTNYYLSVNIAQEKLTFIYGFIPWSAEIVATLTLILPILIFAEISPKNLFRLKANELMCKTAKVQALCIFICKPLTVSLKYLSGILSKSSESDLNYELNNLSSQKLKLIFSEGSKAGTISAHQNHMINNTLEIHKVSVTKIMIPLHRIVSMSVNTPVIDCLKAFKNLSFNNIPVFSGERYNILGTLNFFDVLNAVDIKLSELKPFFRKIPSVNWDDNLQQTFYKLQKNKKTLALVKDKRSKVIGIIYLKDIVNHITEIV